MFYRAFVALAETAVAPVPPSPNALVRCNVPSSTHAHTTLHHFVKFPTFELPVISTLDRSTWVNDVSILYTRSPARLLLSSHICRLTGRRRTIEGTRERYLYRVENKTSRSLLEADYDTFETFRSSSFRLSVNLNVLFCLKLFLYFLSFKSRHLICLNV